MCYPYSLEKRVNRIYKILVAITILFSGFIVILAAIMCVRINSIQREIETLKSPKNSDCVVLEDVLKQQKIVRIDLRKPVTDSAVMEVLKFHNIEHPHIVLAQMKLESANYTSKLALENNNYFGMKQPRKRATTSIGEKNGYASYQSWVHSVLDYALWQREYARQLTENQYLDSLSKYAEDKKYILKIKKLQKNLEIR